MHASFEANGFERELQYYEKIGFFVHFFETDINKIIQKRKVTDNKYTNTLIKKQTGITAH